MKRNDENTELNNIGANLAAAFGVRAVSRKITSRSQTTNITMFDGKGINTHGKSLDRLTFRQAAEIMRKDGIEGNDKDFDRLLARKNGVRLSSGIIFKDVWAKGSHIATVYNED